MIETILLRAGEYLPAAKLDLVERAFEYAKDAHDGQLRKSGEPFIEHPVQTAITMADLKMDADTISAALLHDVAEDCDHISIDDIRREFNGSVARLVDGVTKFTEAEIAVAESAALAAPDARRSRAQAETIRKMLMAMAEDVRVILIKLADRLHNMRTINYLPRAKRVEKARETLNIYAPLAHRLGIWGIKWQLEDLAFQQTNPEEYKSISQRLNSKRAEREAYVEEMRSDLQAKLDSAKIAADTLGRPKHIYSIHNKIRKYAEQNKTVDDIHDLFALRVLVETTRDCYAALGVIHTRWHPAPGEFNDYVANPKDNMYQSIHTTVIADNGFPVEIQIRTREMHQLAEYGVAAHWLYKEGRDGDDPFERKMVWLRQILEWCRGVSDPEEFVESFKTDIFADHIFVYTPLGELKELPSFSTPLDFAFRVHSDLIFRCVGAEVNGRLVPLNYQLSNGDTCRILTSISERAPSLDWLNEERGYLRTGAARARVRQWFNRQERAANVERGRHLYQRRVRRLTSLEDERVAELMGLPGVDQLYAALGSGAVSIANVVSKLSSREEAAEAEVRHQQEAGIPVSANASIEVMGVGDLLNSIARCCSPINGDEIIGFLTRARGVTVHRRDCPNILHRKDDRERLVPVSWGKTEVKYPVRVQVRAIDRVGLLKDVTSVAASEKVNITSCLSEEYDNISIITLTLHVSGINQLSGLFFELESLKGVLNVTRSNNL